MDLARRTRWLERNHRRIAIVAGVITATYLWFQLPCWMGPDWPAIHAHVTAILAGKLLAIAVDFVLIVITSWWQVQLGQAARRGNLPAAIVIDRDP